MANPLRSGLELIDVAGATGYLDTNYHGKGDAAVAALDEFDFVEIGRASCRERV